MRNVTIRRERRFAACLASVKVYIEDRESGDLVIGSVPCRKLGNLKNGEEKTFQIGSQAARIYVIGDKLSRNLSHEFVEVPAGTEDVVLTGHNVVSPGAGNPFRFDGNDSPEVQKNRRSNSRVGVMVMILAMIVGIFAGRYLGRNLIQSSASKEKVFTCGEMQITLADRFKEEAEEGFTTTFNSRDMVVLVLREGFELGDDFKDYTLEEYAGLVCLANNRSEDDVTITDSSAHFSYTDKPTGAKQALRYEVYMYKGNEAFWLVQFVTNESDAAKLASQVAAWAASVRFVG